MPKRSAGILLYRGGPGGPEFFLVHPGGPFWARKDAGVWSIPKGLYEPDEDAAAAARREFAEEVGTVPPGELLPLGEFRQPGGKLVVAFGLAGDFPSETLKSNHIELQWPPRSGRTISVPEVDRAGWFTAEEAREKLLPGQRPILDALLERLAGTGL